MAQKRRIALLLERIGNWRARKKIGTLTERARCSFSAAQTYEEDKDYKAMLLEIEEGIEEAEELKRYLLSLQTEKPRNFI